MKNKFEIKQSIFNAKEKIKHAEEHMLKNLPNNLTVCDLKEICEKCPSADYGYALLEEKIKNYSNIEKWLENHKKENINKFCNRYNEIFAENLGWPMIKTIDDFYQLPENILSECTKIHNFSPEAWIKDSGDSNFFNPTLASVPFFMASNETIFNNSGYTFSQLFRAKYHILDYTDIFKNKSVLELGSPDGFFSALAVLNGASSATAIDVLDYHIKMSEFSREYLELQDKLSIKKHDINNLQKTTDIVKKHDVVFSNNFLISVPNKFEVLCSICEGNPEYIILGEPMSFSQREERGNTKFQNSQSPIIEYVMIHNKEKYNMFYSNYPQHEEYHKDEENEYFMLGVANQSWFKMVLGYYGYVLEKTQSYTLGNSKNYFKSCVYKKL